MKNEIIRTFENDNIIVYKRIERQGEKIPLYFVASKKRDFDNFDGIEFKSITQVKKFIKNL